MTRYRTWRLGCRASLLAITWATLSWSAPALRKHVNVQGDFLFRFTTPALALKAAAVAVTSLGHATRLMHGWQ